MLTARIGELLAENGQLVQDLAKARSERDALERALHALQRNEAKKEIRTMATSPVNLGDILQYQPTDPTAAAVAALVIGVHDDGTSDVRAYLGYCQGTMDVQNVQFSEAAELGKVSKVGAKPKEAKDAPKPKAEAKSEAK